MSSICGTCGAGFPVEQEDLEFYHRISPTVAGEPCPMPPPSLCPECRFQRRAVWRNEFKYYRRECPCCNHKSISVHAPENPYPVYCNKCWWSESWDPLSFGMQLSLDVPFFEQFLALQSRLPKPFLANDNHTVSENIEYCQGVAYSKNCYLATTSWRLEECLYCSNCGESRSLVDCRFVGDGSELVYESATCQRCYRCSHLYGCSGCRDCYFGIDLRGCADCIGCVGLRNRRFCIFNEQLSEARYRERVLELDLGSHSKLEELTSEFEAFSKAQAQRGVYQINCERSTGNNIFNCKNFAGFNVWGGEDCKHYIIGTRPKNCYDILVGGEHEWCYEGVNPDHSYMSHFTIWCWSCTNSLYSDNCHSCKNIFGCIGLRRAEYCILNRQYGRDEYEQLMMRLVEAMRARGEWGEFFPMAVSPFAYNETIAQEYFPLSPALAAASGVRWRKEKEVRVYSVGAEVPDHIDQVPEEIVREVLHCAHCKAHYKISLLELKFYRTMRLPIPRRCADCRRAARFRRSGTFRTWQVSCSRCGDPTESATPVGEREHILCPSCYEGVGS